MLDIECKPATFCSAIICSIEQSVCNVCIFPNIFADLLWTAPEVLCDHNLNRKGSKEADVYSFGIILHEIFYRRGVFAGNEHMAIKGKGYW